MVGMIWMERLKIGVIGTGHMGRNHVRNLAEEQRFELVGIYDNNAATATEIGDRFGVSVYENLDELLENVQGVVIAVPSSLHKEIGLKAASHGVHALIEKPLATSSKDARELAEEFERRSIKLAVGHIERFNPVIVELQKIIKPEEIFYVEVHRYSPFVNSGRIVDTSVVEDLMIHDTDLVCNLMDGIGIKSIQGYGESICSGQTDFASCLIDFEVNAHAVINASRISQDKVRTLEIHTAECCIYADLIAKTLFVSKNTNMTIDTDTDNKYKQDSILQKIYVPIQEPLRMELLMFYESVVNGKPIIVDGNAGIRAIEICEEVAQQITAKQEEKGRGK